MNPFSFIIYTYITVALILIYILNRARKNKTKFLGKYSWVTFILMGMLGVSIILGLYTRFIEPYWINVTTQTIHIAPDISQKSRLTKPIKIVFIADLHVGENKKTAWTQKVVTYVKKINPDLVLLGGDYIANDETPGDESIYFEPLKELSQHFPIYYIMGNHEYGMYARKVQLNPNKSELVKNRMKQLNIPLLLNELGCLEIKQQKICIFGGDDVYRENYNFDALEKWDTNIPLIYLIHDPDGILYWPEEFKKPDLQLAGHTHGGQIYLPLIGPLGRVEVFLGPAYYRGLNEYKGTPTYTTLGLGESAGPIRFWSRPEISIITLVP